MMPLELVGSDSMRYIMQTVGPILAAAILMGCDGEPQETDEATPIWTRLDSIPYEKMWADDREWLPLLLEGTYFDGRFLFDGDTMLAHEINTVR